MRKLNTVYPATAAYDITEARAACQSSICGVEYSTMEDYHSIKPHFPLVSLLSAYLCRARAQIFVHEMDLGPALLSELDVVLDSCSSHVLYPEADFALEPNLSVLL
ncbi:hypothetical protein EVAR_8853_1 [Eumeta japonica]|uniref:Uncharacterized protein n=1 Tax=Eumeta variegata TaxID=151549 RepID=A0A4C1TUP7_EUMVA|nr:hypothetical protein EVAR_8853_1 [Eumeta japonica]